MEGWKGEGVRESEKVERRGCERVRESGRMERRGV